MSHYSHPSRNYEFQKSEYNGSRGISSTPGDQRDTGSGFMCPFKCCLESIITRKRDNENSDWEFQIHFKQCIGKGGFGSVYRAQKYFKNIDNPNGPNGQGWHRSKDKNNTEIIDNYAVKELKYSNQSEFCQVKKVLDIESAVCEKLKILNDPHNRHDNIVKPLQILYYPKRNIGYIVMEYCSGGDLARYLKECNGERVVETEARTIMYQITKGKINHIS